MLHSNELIALAYQQEALRTAQQRQLVHEALWGRTKTSLYQRAETWLASVLSRRIATQVSTREMQNLSPKTHHAG